MDAVESLVQQALGSEYSVERELRGGGAARVVIARDHRLGRRVVVKILSNEYVTPDRIERFRREIQLAISLQHPHIVPILSAGDADGLAYLVMPFIEGESLRARLESGPLGVVEAVRVLRGIALALAYAHGRGVVHRDVKPDNVLLAGGTPMVADFGIAKAIARARDDQATGDHTLTLAGTSVGTPTYMAPEQIVASPETDHRTDIYGFGVLAYEILAGTPPFRGSTTQQLFTAHLTEAPAPLWQHRKDVPQALSLLIMRCLAKDPGGRPQSADDLAATLEGPEMVSGHFDAPDPVVAPPAAVPRRRPRVLFGLGIMAAVLIAIAAWLGGGRGSDEPRPAAEPPATAAVTPVIAVLPLASVGDDVSAAATAVADEITSALGALDGVRVLGTTRSAALQRSIIEGRDLPAELYGYVEGAVYRENGELRIAIRLVGADGVTIAAAAGDSSAGLREMAAAAAARIAAVIGESGHGVSPDSVRGS